MPFDVPDDGDYEVYAELARGSDYGIYTVLARRQAAGVDAPSSTSPERTCIPQTAFDGYAPETYVGRRLRGGLAAASRRAATP